MIIVSCLLFAVVYYLQLFTIVSCLLFTGDYSQLFTTCSRLVIIKQGQAIRTFESMNPDVGLMTTSMQGTL